MKRILLLAALAAASAACQQLPTNGNLANQPSNVNAAASPAPTVSDKDITDKEKQIWDAINAKNYDAFAALLAEEEIYVTVDGVRNKAETVDDVKNLSLTEPAALSDWKVVHLDKDAVVVTYTVRIKGTYRGQPLPPDIAERHSTAWVKRADGQWLAYYHQDTRVETPTAAAPTPAPSASPAATATPVAAASPTPAPATPTEVENAIWDALRRKDWDGFAAFLADDSVEVEPDGVVDKAGSVNGVKTIDFTGVTLNDMRELKLDADASLVTYLVKGPQPPFNGAGGRHTTIQIKRSGRWLAVFHQGTQAEGQ